MATISMSYGALTTMTTTNLQSLATSATAGWESNAVDNSSDLFLDVMIRIKIAAVNTAPANSRALFVFAFGELDAAGSDYTATGSDVYSGSEGACTFPDFTSLEVVAPLLARIPYPVQNKIIDSGPVSLRRCFGGNMPVKWGLGIINHTGMTLAASGNVIKWLGIKNTVA